MAKNEMYEIMKNVERIRKGYYTNFIPPNYLKQICNKLFKDEFYIYYPYKDCDKVILYTHDIPHISLYEIVSYNSLKHSDILGSLFGLNISNEMFGDIVIFDGKYYIYLIDDISQFIVDNFKMVGRNYVSLREVPLDTLNDYKRQFEEHNVVVSSLRIDTIISRIVGISRNYAKDKISDGDVLLNYTILENTSYLLKPGDIFSIRKFGKYKFIGVLNKTKKDNYIISYCKYI